MDRPGPAGPCPPPRGRPHGQARAAQVKEAATAKRPRREMHSPPMPASKPPCVATARSWPTAPAGDGRTQCDSLCAAPGPVACRRLGPVCQPGASPRRSRAVTGPAGQAQARWPHVRAAKAIRAVFLADGGGNVHHLSVKYLVKSDVAALRIQSSPQFFRLVPRFLPAGESQKLAISEFPKWRKYLISLSFRGQSSVRPVQVGGFDVNIVIHRSTAVRGRGGPARHDAWPPSLGAILAHTDGPCGS